MLQNVASDPGLTLFATHTEIFRTHKQVRKWTFPNFRTRVVRNWGVPILTVNKVHPSLRHVCPYSLGKYGIMYSVHKLRKKALKPYANTEGPAQPVYSSIWSRPLFAAVFYCRQWFIRLNVAVYCTHLIYGLFPRLVHNLVKNKFPDQTT